MACGDYALSMVRAGVHGTTGALGREASVDSSSNDIFKYLNIGAECALSECLKLRAQSSFGGIPVRRDSRVRDCPEVKKRGGPWGDTCQ